MSLEAPYALLAELTHRCPLRCPYCSNPVDLVRRGQELDTSTWKHVLRQAAEMGILQVHFSGGEPTARRDIEELVGYAEAQGLYTNLITSGILSDAQQIERLAGVGLSHVQISIQDSEADRGDWIAGYPGAQQKKLALAESVEAAGLALTINAVIHRQNIDRVGEMIDLAVAMKAQRVEIANVQYYGWGIRNRRYLMPSLAQLKIMDQLVKARIAELQGVIVIDYVVPDYYAARPKACMNGWGTIHLTIAPDGKALPCQEARVIEGLEFPNVRDHPLEWIWKYSPTFMKYRGDSWMKEPCVSCDEKETDFGGCRCQAFLLTGDAASTDPACSKSKHFHIIQSAIAAAETRQPPRMPLVMRTKGAVSHKLKEQVGTSGI